MQQFNHLVHARNRAFVLVEVKLRFLWIRKLLSISPGGQKAKRDNSMMQKGKTRVPSNRSASQSNLGKVKAKLLEF